MTTQEKRKQLEELHGLDFTEWSEETINYEYHREFSGDDEENPAEGILPDETDT